MLVADGAPYERMQIRRAVQQGIEIKPTMTAEKEVGVLESIESMGVRHRRRRYHRHRHRRPFRLDCRSARPSHTPNVSRSSHRRVAGRALLRPLASSARGSRRWR